MPPENPCPAAWSRRALLGVLACLLACGTSGCKRSPRGAPAGPVASASASGATPEVARCTGVAKGAAYRIGEAGPTGSAGEAEDLPFATELGPGVGYAGGFALGALAATAEGTQAVVALIGADGASGRLVKLGPHHGGVAPPHVVARGAELFIVAPSTDAAGATLRLGVMRDRDADSVTWGAELSEGWDASQAYAVVVGAQRGFVAWDTWTKGKARSAVVLATFDPADVSRVSAPVVLSEKDADAEGPHLVARPGGTWLVYVVRAPDRAAPGAKAAEAALDDGTGTVVDLGRRSLVVLPLNERGEPVGAPRRVSEEDAHVLVFDVATLPNGNALVVWRNDAASPGVEGGTLEVAEVRLDGTIERRQIVGEDLGSGSPNLMVAPGEKAGGLWLTVGGLSDETQLAALDGHGKLRDALRPEPVVGRGDLVARRDDVLLVATPRGRAIEVATVRCTPGAVAAPAPSSGPAGPPPLPPLPEGEPLPGPELAAGGQGA